MVKNNADIDHQDNRGMTALMYASKQNSLEILRFLITSGADMDLVNKENKKAIDLTQNKEIKKLLN